MEENERAMPGEKAGSFGPMETSSRDVTTGEVFRWRI